VHTLARTAVILSYAAATQGCHRSAPKPPDADAQIGEAVAPAASADRTASVDRSATLLGGERGLDHVGIAVKNLEEATHTYHDLLGFERPIEGKLPNGLRNVNYYFGDATYLETLVYWDREKASWLADFTDKHTGALFAVLSAFSPEDTSQFLAARGFHVTKPVSGTIQTAGQDAMPEEQWKTFFLPDGLLPGDPLYFISYKRAPRDEYLGKLDDPETRRKLHHRNSALGLHAVWFAVPDLGAASKAYESIGLPRGQTFVDPALHADGQVFGAGAGEIWLFAPSSPEGKLADFLKERGGPGILGVTIEAGSVAQAAKVIGERTGTSIPTYEGVFGPSIRVGPELTHGVWLEFSHRRSPAAAH
jgi:catechol 2,3-dioxygenase-like lactoylglutathione lyase family enzyme